MTAPVQPPSEAEKIAPAGRCGTENRHPSISGTPASEQQRKPPFSCGRCGQRWGGTLTAHCSGCHQTFTGLTAFDRHRDGDHAKSTRHCRTPHDVGLELNRNGY